MNPDTYIVVTCPYTTLTGVHKVHGQVYPYQYHVIDLLVVITEITHPLLIAGKLPISFVQLHVHIYHSHFEKLFWRGGRHQTKGNALVNLTQTTLSKEKRSGDIGVLSWSCTSSHDCTCPYTNLSKESWLLNFRMSSEPFPHMSGVIRERDNTSVQIKADLNILVCRGGVLYLECMHEHVHVWWFPTRAGSFLQSDMHVPTLAIYDRKIHVHLCMYISYTSSFGC